MCIRDSFTEALWGFTLIGFALTTTFTQAVVAISAIGFVSAVNMSLNRSLVQLQVEQHMRGRVMSLDMMAHGAMPLGMLPIGYISEVVSVEAGLAASGALLFLCTIIVMIIIPKIRTINIGFVTPAT